LDVDPNTNIQWHEGPVSNYYTYTGLLLIDPFTGFSFFNTFPYTACHFPFLPLFIACVWAQGAAGFHLWGAHGYACCVGASAPSSGTQPSLPIGGLNAKWGQSLNFTQPLSTMFMDMLMLYSPWMPLPGGGCSCAASAKDSL
jgi:hypothetical protein